MTAGQRVQMHYDEAVKCLNRIGDSQDDPVAGMTAAPVLVQCAMAHALLGLLVARKRWDGSS